MPFLIQRAMAGVGLVILSPALVLIAVAVRLSSPGPAIHRAVRVGRFGRHFVLVKFRTMDISLSGSAITVASDQRVTAIGRRLRRSKLDELPQLWNVLRGDMALVGPRPEDPRFVDLSDPLQCEVLAVRPGITGPTALEYADEEGRLAVLAERVARSAGRERATIEDIDRAYRSAILPAKLRMDAGYVRSRSPMSDLRIIGRTFGLMLGR